MKLKFKLFERKVCLNSVLFSCVYHHERFPDLLAKESPAVAVAILSKLPKKVRKKIINKLRGRAREYRIDNIEKRIKNIGKVNPMTFRVIERVYENTLLRKG